MACNPQVMRLLVGLDTNLLPQDMRKYNGKPKTKANNVDAFFTYYHWSLVPGPLIGRFLLLEPSTEYFFIKLDVPIKQKLANKFYVSEFLLQAEPLAEDPQPEVLQGAAMCTSGLFLPGHLKNGIFKITFCLAYRHQKSSK